MQLLIEPEDGTEAIVDALRRARQSVEIVIFRMDRKEIERALVAAAERGVRVQAMIAFTNRGGEKQLRRLESRLLAKGVQVTRSADDLVRYHGKMLIVDRRTLLVLGFNFTHLDLRSRSFGLLTRQRPLLRDAVELFECDCQRKPYTPGGRDLVVSPANARARLAEFVRGARKQLLLYDVDVSDGPMLKLLLQRQERGVDVRLLGHAAGALPQRVPRVRLHARVMVRDGRQLFLGSQSLRALELDSRREIGVIVRQAKLAEAVRHVFEKDWEEAATSQQVVRALVGEKVPPAKALKKMAKAIARQLPPTPALAKAVGEVIQDQTAAEVNRQDIEEAVRDAVKDAVKEAVRHVVGSAVEADIRGR